MLSREQIESNKQEIISLLRSTQREGIEKVIKYLFKSNFFIIDSSRDRHHNWHGGLFRRLQDSPKTLRRATSGQCDYSCNSA